MQTLTPDLETALAFVIGRVKEEATRSGVPLDDEQQYLLTHLPATSELPLWSDPEVPQLVPRDLVYERLCTLTKAARLNDLRARPAAACEWEFAAAVFDLYRHPMLWVLQWAGLKKRWPWWDRGLLIGTALVVTSCGVAAMAFAATRSQVWTWINWTLFGLGCAIVIVSAYLASRKFRNWQRKQIVENRRSELR